MAQSPRDLTSSVLLLLNLLLGYGQSAGWQSDRSLVPSVYAVLNQSSPAHVCRATAENVPKLIDSGSQLLTLSHGQVVSYPLHHGLQTPPPGKQIYQAFVQSPF